MGTPDPDSPLTNLGLNLSRSCRYLYEHQGVPKLDLVWVLHGILGQVLSWEDGMSEKDMYEDNGSTGTDLPPFNPDDLT